jgi:hypothetical protein
MKLKGRHRPDEAKKKMSISHLGKCLTAEHKEKIRNSCKHINGKMVLCITTGILYPSATCAAMETGISRSGITACCRGETDACKQTSWKYVEGGVLNGK